MNPVSRLYCTPLPRRCFCPVIRGSYHSFSALVPLVISVRFASSVTRRKKKQTVPVKTQTLKRTTKNIDHITHNTKLFDTLSEEVMEGEVEETAEESEEMDLMSSPSARDIEKEGYEPDEDEVLGDSERDIVERQDRKLKPIVEEEKSGSVFDGEENTEEGFQSKHVTDCYPDLALEYAASNPKSVTEIMVDDPGVVTWVCAKCQHNWQCGVFVRCSLKNSCPVCYRRSHKTIAEKRPDLALLYDRSRNDPFKTPDTIEADSRAIVYWRCPQCNQSYQARVKDRCQEKSKCPSCSLTNVQSENDLTQEESILLQEWHPLKNGDLRLDQIQPSDNKTKVWWICTTCGHDWEASVAARLSRNKRTKGKSCPVCSNKTDASNSQK